MNSQRKIMLFTIGLFFFAILTIVLVIAHQADQLQREQHKFVESAYLATKQNEIKNYLNIAKLAIAHLHTTEDPIDLRAQEEAKNILRKLKFDGNDGYYFIHDFDCKNILQPPDPAREGKYECDRTDSSGKYHIKELIDVAKKEGEGFVHYDVIKPSTEKITPKLSYVVAIAEWNWVLGTGMYLDDVNHVLVEIDAQLLHTISESMRWIAAITLLGLLALSVIQIRIGKMIEHTRVARKLHGKVKQDLAYTVKKLDQELIPLHQPNTEVKIRDQEFFTVLQEVSERALENIITIIEDRDPEILLLVDELENLKKEFERRERIPINFSPLNEIRSQTNPLSEAKRKALIEVTRDALNNISTHAAANQVEMHLQIDTCNIILTIHDNGIGFDIDRVSRGMGLDDMETSMKEVGGTLLITSSPDKGTTITATVAKNHTFWSYILCLLKRP